jgi:predicted GIY-YIG superfamily endonuclease
LQKTKAFLKLLALEAQICAAELIKLGAGSKNSGGADSHLQNKQTWVHPQVAINIAQWISPAFDLKVSGWVYEIMMTGKVDITATKTYKQLQQENKDHKIRIRLLEKKYMKCRPRVQYKEKYVVYILTTKRMKKDRVYILGKATDLTPRLSTYQLRWARSAYNKSDEHQVVYYQECGDEETMALVENTVFHHLKEHREQANRERNFVLFRCCKEMCRFF